MKLVTPRLVGPVTEWSSSLMVENCLTGATVVVTSTTDNRVVAKGLAKGGRDRMPLVPGERLFATDRLISQQARNGDSSSWTDPRMALKVGAAPVNHASLAPVRFLSHIFECGAGLWVAGAVPGAEVRVTSSSGQLGVGRSEEGHARMLLTGFLPPPGGSIDASQAPPPGFPAIAGTPKITSAAVDPLPVPPGSRLPTPTLVSQEAKGCETSLRIGGVIDGAVVTLTRSDGSTEAFTFDLSTLWFRLASPLDPAGDTLRVTQTMSRCRQHHASDPLIVPVGPATIPDPPEALPPCEGAPFIAVQNLSGGALLHIVVNGTEYLAQVPPDVTKGYFEVDPVPPSATVLVTQEHCGLVSTPPFVAQGYSFGSGVNARLIEPLWGCARVVRVEKARPGSLLQIWTREQGGPAMPISPRVVAWDFSVQIRVVPHLIEGNEVWVEQLSCAGDWETTGPQPVLAPPQDGFPAFALPPVVRDTSVQVDAEPGAHVEVFTQPIGGAVEFLGGADVDRQARTVGLKRPIDKRDRLFATQELCYVSDHSLPVEPLSDTRVFMLPAPIKRPSTRGKDLICDQAIVTCRHDGTWNAVAHFKNEETEADVSFLFQFDIDYVHPTGFKFGVTMDHDLSAAGNGPITKTGLRIKGVPPDRSIVESGTFGPFRDTPFWIGVMTSTFKFQLFASFRDYQPTPEAPDGEDPPEKKKPKPGGGS